MRPVSIILLLLVLAACGTDHRIINRTDVLVPLPSDDLVGEAACPQTPPSPDEASSTQASVAEFMAVLREAHRKCRISHEALRKYLDEAKAIGGGS
jgi:hypothetical protein